MLGAATDAQLKAIKGIGPAKLHTIRPACAAACKPASEIVNDVGSKATSAAGKSLIPSVASAKRHAIYSKFSFILICL